MLSSGIPRVSEYQELDKEPDFKRLLDYSRRFRAEVEARDVFSRLYSIKWYDYLSNIRELAPYCL